MIVTPAKLKVKVERQVLRRRDDNGRESRYVEVEIEGVPATGLIDTRSDITIIRGDMLNYIVSTARIDHYKIRSGDQRACTYYKKPITLHGQIDLNVSW